MLVVDASVTVQACLEDAGFSPLAGEELVAPYLLWSEASSVLHEMAWRGTISTELRTVAVQRLLDAPIRPRRPARLLREAWRIADQLGWAKTYDAEYVALARLLGCRLVTIDARLVRAAAGQVEVIGPRKV